MRWRLITVVCTIAAIYASISSAAGEDEGADECPGNQEVLECASCKFTCNDVITKAIRKDCEGLCTANSCGCPEHIPVLHNGMCIAESDCPSPNPCKGVKCGAGYKCTLHEVACVSSPCPIIPVCESLAGPLCDRLPCHKGSTCKVDETTCIGIPDLMTCDHVATCVDDAICKSPKDSGPCEKMVQKWYFNNETEICEEFDYGGCSGNGNRFISKPACELACKPYDPCEKGECELGYACESRDVECVRAPCLPVAECVDLTEQCEDMACPSGQTCKLVEVQCVTGSAPCYPQPTCVDEGFCEQPEAVRGNCDDWVKRWYYSNRDNNCQKFDYSGCGGTENRFVSKSDCERSCQNPDHAFCPLGEPLRDYRGITACCGGGGCPEPITCPSSHECHAHPAGAFAVCCPRQDLTKCQWSKMINSDPRLMDAPSVDCDSEGNYAKKQCNGFTGTCSCVTPEEGMHIPNSTTSRGQGENCDAAQFQPYYGEKYCFMEQEQSKKFTGAYKPFCNKFGLYEKKQCYNLGSTEQCWCVTLEGKEDLDSDCNWESNGASTALTRPQAIHAILLGFVGFVIMAKL